MYLRRANKILVVNLTVSPTGSLYNSYVNNNKSALQNYLMEFKQDADKEYSIMLLKMTCFLNSFIALK